MKKILIALLAVITLLNARVHAQESTPGLELVFNGGEYTSTALLVDTQVEIAIDGLVARVRIFQNFENIGSDWAEGIYRFPISDGVAIDEMRLRIGDRVLEGEIQEKEQARETYTEARDNGVQATLVEQEGGNTFSARVANIAPGEWVQVEIAYLQEVEFDSDHFSLRFPMTFTPGPGTSTAMPPVDVISTANVGDGGALPKNAFTMQISLNPGLPLTEVRSLYHDVEVQPMEDEYQIQFSELAVTGNRDFVLAWYPEMGDEPIIGVLSEDFEGETYFLVMLVPPIAKSVGVTARELILIIDTSGSMQGDSMYQAREALDYALSNLHRQDYFNLIQFNSLTTAFAPKPLPATQQNLDLARDWINSLIAGGGTVMAPALEKALLGQPATGLLKQVVFITDGSVASEQELFAQIKQDLGPARLFTVGIGAAPNSYFMRKAAESGRGTFSYIGQTTEVREIMAGLFDKLQQPALTDVCVNWPGKAMAYPETVPDLYAGEPISVAMKMSFVDGNLSLCGKKNGSNWSSSLALENATPARGIATLWARRKLESLQDQSWSSQDPELIKEEIIELALKHHLLSQYTSLIAVDKTPVRSKEASLKRQLVGNAAPLSADSVGMPATALGLGSSLLLGFVGLMLMFSSRLRFLS